MIIGVLIVQANVGIGRGAAPTAPAARHHNQHTVAGLYAAEVICEAEVVDHIERLQVEQELIALVLVTQKGVPLVQSPEQVVLVQQLAQVPREGLLLEREADKGARHANLGLDLAAAAQLVDSPIFLNISFNLK